MAAVTKYYDYNGEFIENPEGLLAGIEWLDEGGNSVRAIVFLIDMSTLQNGRYISFMYRLQVKPVAQEIWILKDTKEVRITQDVLINPNPENLVKAFSAPQPNDPAPDPGAIGQLEYFIGIYYKGNHVPPGQMEPIYGWLLQIVANREGVEIDDTPHTFLNETLNIIAQLEAQGFTLSDEQKKELDMLIRRLREGSVPAMSDEMAPEVVTYLSSIGINM